MIKPNVGIGVLYTIGVCICGTCVSIEYNSLSLGFFCVGVGIVLEEILVFLKGN